MSESSSFTMSLYGHDTPGLYNSGYTRTTPFSIGKLGGRAVLVSGVIVIAIVVGDDCSHYHQCFIIKSTQYVRKSSQISRLRLKPPGQSLPELNHKVIGIPEHHPLA